MIELNKEEILNKFKNKKKVGYVVIIGRPNAGKSTFINTLIGEKISIISKVPQTTRKRILAIYNDIDSQIIFFDTPGIHQNDKIFNKEINKEAIKSLKEVEVILYFIDISRDYGEEEKEIENILNVVNIPILKIYTKIDLKQNIEIPIGENIFKISSINKIGFEEVLNKIKTYLKDGNIFYPEDFYTDQNIYFRISEIIREKVFLNSKEEIPHSVYVEVGEIEETQEILKIQAYIYTETDSQRYIIIGKSGNLITKIGIESRFDLEKIFSKKIFLSLRVKTLEKWRKNEKIIKNILQ